MGAFVTEQLLAEHWRELRGAVLVGPIGKGRANEPVAGFAAELATLEDPMPRELALEFQESTIARPIAPELARAVREREPRRPGQGVARIVRGLPALGRVGPAGRRRASRCSSRTAIRTRSGPTRRPTWLLDTLPDARLSTYEGTGHAVHWEEPERLAREIAELAASL